MIWHNASRFWPAPRVAAAAGVISRKSRYPSRKFVMHGFIPDLSHALPGNGHPARYMQSSRQQLSWAASRRRSGFDAFSIMSIRAGAAQDRSVIDIPFVG